MPLINVAESRDVFKSELKALGKLTSFEMRVGFVFLLTVFLWLLHPLFVLIVGLTLIILFMTEITSNTATAAVFLSIASSLAAAIGVPTQAFVLPVALASSCAFMLPIATPPNAIVYGTGTFTMRQIVKAGFALNIVSALVIASLTMVFIKFG